MWRKAFSIFTLLMIAGTLKAAPIGSDFCRAIKAVPLKNYENTVKLIHGQGSVRTSENSAGNGRSLEDIQRVAAPYALSPALQQVFADNSEAGEGAYDVYRSGDDTLFQFTDVQGSMKCAYDIWAIKRGATLDLLPDGPDLGEACDVVRTYGVFRNKSVLIQYLYRAGEAGSGSARSDDIEEIRAVELVPGRLTEVCVIDPE